MRLTDVRISAAKEAIHPIDETQSEQQPQFWLIIDIFRRRYRQILTIAVAGVLAATVASLLVPIKYTAKAQLIVDPQLAPQQFDAPIESATDDHAIAGRPRDEASDEAMLDTHVTAVASPAFLRGIVDGFFNSTDDARREGGARALTTAPGSKPGQRSPTDSPKRIERFSDASDLNTVGASPSVAGMEQRLKVWIDAFAKKKSPQRALLDPDDPDAKLKVIRERRSHIITIGFTADSAEKAAAFANRIVKTYVANRANLKRDSIRQRLAQLDERISVMKGYAASATGEARTMMNRPAGGAYNVGSFRDQRLRELISDAASAHQLLPKLEQQRTYLHGQLDNFKPDAEIFSLASVPEVPSSLSPILFVLPALIISLIAGWWTAVLLEHADQGLRSERDITNALGIPCLGFVPKLGWKWKRRPYLYLFAQPYSAYAEAVRSIVASLSLLGSDRARKSILITSSVPGEGKTTFAISLAVFVAKLGKRVILIDPDYGNASMLVKAGLKAGGEVTSLPFADQPLESAIEHISALRVDYLRVRSRTAEPLDLFAEDQMPRMLRELSNSYDWVIIDGPALSILSEARLLAEAVDKVVFVVQWGAVRRQIVENTIALLRTHGVPGRSGARIAGSVVTQVDLAQHARYRFGDMGELLSIYQRQHVKGPKVAGEAPAPTTITPVPSGAVALVPPEVGSGAPVAQKML